MFNFLLFIAAILIITTATQSMFLFATFFCQILNGSITADMKFVPFYLVLRSNRNVALSRL